MESSVYAVTAVQYSAEFLTACRHVIYNAIRSCRGNQSIMSGFEEMDKKIHTTMPLGMFCAVLSGIFFFVRTGLATLFPVAALGVLFSPGSPFLIFEKCSLV